MASKKRQRGPKKGKRAAKKSKRGGKKRHLTAAHKRKLMAGLRRHRAAKKYMAQGYTAADAKHMAGKRRAPRRSRKAKR